MVVFLSAVKSRRGDVAKYFIKIFGASFAWEF